MKIDKKLIKELVDNLKEFGLTELEYQEGQTKIKVSKASKMIEQSKTSVINFISVFNNIRFYCYFTNCFPFVFTQILMEYFKNYCFK